MVKKITFKISGNGEVNLAVDGVQGSSCEDLSRPFEEVIGKVSGRELKDSYYQNSEESQSQSSGQGENHE